MSGVAELLVRGILAGRWTLEDLDQPSPGWRENAAMAEKLALRAGRQPPVHVNRAREWIEAHPEEFRLLLDQAQKARQQPQQAAQAPSPAVAVPNRQKRR